MDHSLGALLAQKNEEGAKQAIYYFSRTLIGAESPTTQLRRSVLLLFSPSRRCGITWSGRLFMSFQESILFGSLWQSQVPWTPGWLIGPYCCPNMIWPSYPEGYQGSSPSRLLGSSSNSKNFKATWRYSRRNYRSQHNFRWWCIAAVLWWCIKNQTKGQDCCRSGRSIYLTRESRPSSCILANRTLF